MQALGPFVFTAIVCQSLAAAECALPRGGDDGAGSGGQIGLCAFAVPLENWEQEAVFSQSNIRSAHPAA